MKDIQEKRALFDIADEQTEEMMASDARSRPNVSDALRQEIDMFPGGEGGVK
ncbi:MAG: hypothetical protein GX099_03240 [Clostridiaceae bacterium]|jgi:hypothetical protein|nr:hypothetical protein [Clostridiaceae bacterium]